MSMTIHVSLVVTLTLGTWMSTSLHVKSSGYSGAVDICKRTCKSVGQNPIMYCLLLLNGSSTTLH